ncbi:hypothetical protein [Mycolicibacterium chlorophenolicum]|uniref:hypothetical protein n=1 Tax=Mycolicibacterium chlorophenolicum TaxID=37916 RepID=UPI00103C4CB9|nr:hypothetical protein [Mycolicibacterium chlorophenolicum]
MTKRVNPVAGLRRCNSDNEDALALYVDVVDLPVRAVHERPQLVLNYGGVQHLDTVDVSRFGPDDEIRNALALASRSLWVAIRERDDCARCSSR